MRQVRCLRVILYNITHLCYVVLTPRQAMKTLLKDQGDAVTLQKRVMDLEMQVAELKFKFTESEFEKDVCSIP